MRIEDSIVFYFDFFPSRESLDLSGSLHGELFLANGNLLLQPPTNSKGFFTMLSFRLQGKVDLTQTCLSRWLVHSHQDLLITCLSLIREGLI